MFHCDKCGKCCQYIGRSPIYSFLDRGDGVCRYYEDNTKLCSIYKNRPVICRVDDMYDLYFKEMMTKEEYYELNYQSCMQLKELKFRKIG